MRAWKCRSDGEDDTHFNAHACKLWAIKTILNKKSALDRQCVTVGGMWAASMRAQSLLLCGGSVLSYSLWVKRGGLSLTSVSLTVTVVVPDRPPRWPPMSLAWSNTKYWSWVSLSISGTAVRRIPEDQHMRQAVNDDDSQATTSVPFIFQPPPDELKKTLIKLVSSSSAVSVAMSVQPCPSLRDFCLLFSWHNKHRAHFVCFSFTDFH